MVAEFNKFRKDYDDLSFDELKELEIGWYKKYPHQVHHDKVFFLSAFNTVIEELEKDIKVIELGGHDGHLALDILREQPYIEWLNVEIIDHHRVLKELESYNYREHVLSKQMWEEELNIEDYDVFVSSNTIEHLSDSDFIKLAKRLTDSEIEYIILQMPIPPEGQIWLDYCGSHDLHMGSNEMKNLLGTAYQLIREEGEWCSLWHRP